MGKLAGPPRLTVNAPAPAAITGPALGLSQADAWLRQQEDSFACVPK